MSADTTQTQYPNKYDRWTAATKAVPAAPTIVVHPFAQHTLGLLMNRQSPNQKRERVS